MKFLLRLRPLLMIRSQMIFCNIVRKQNIVYKIEIP